MKKPAVFLALFQQYSKFFTWLAFYAMGVFITSTHQSPSAAFAITNVTFAPLLASWVLYNYLIIPRMLHKYTVWFFVFTVFYLAVMSIIATEADSYIYLKMYEANMLNLPSDVERQLKSGISPRSYLHAKYTLLIVITIATTAIAWLLDEHKRISQQTKENRTQLELKYLRAQINPHFLFNALNCIYTLTLIQDEKAPDSVLKLSEMLRYITDDCKADTVPLQKEIDYIHNYIDFQRIRMEQEPDVVFNIQMSNPQTPIPPMIFQPMIENCFKHSRIVDHPDGFIHIDLKQTEKALYFTAENSMPVLPFASHDEESLGVGLNNVQQRLALIFGDRCTFSKTVIDRKYRVELCIKS